MTETGNLRPSIHVEDGCLLQEIDTGVLCLKYGDERQYYAVEHATHGKELTLRGRGKRIQRFLPLDSIMRGFVGGALLYLLSFSSRRFCVKGTGPSRTPWAANKPYLPLRRYLPI